MAQALITSRATARWACGARINANIPARYMTVAPVGLTGFGPVGQGGVSSGSASVTGVRVAGSEDVLVNIGRVGVWSGELVRLPASQSRAIARAIEDLGYGAVWYPESFTKEALAQAAVLLAATDRLAVCTGIANIWARDPVAMANGARTIAEAFPGRFVLGIGVSHDPTVAARGHDYQRPLATMRGYLDAMDEAPYHGAPPEALAPTVLAALGPKMLELAAARTAGAHPYFVPVEHTRVARSVMGEGPLLAPEQAVVNSTDPDAARAAARNHMAMYLRLSNYRNNLLRLGWEQADLDAGGSDRLVDAIVAWGDEEAIASRVSAHLDAGADHVCVQVLPTDDDSPVPGLRALASSLLSL